MRSSKTTNFPLAFWAHVKMWCADLIVNVPRLNVISKRQTRFVIKAVCWCVSEWRDTCLLITVHPLSTLTVGSLLITPTVIFPSCVIYSLATDRAPMLGKECVCVCVCAVSYTHLDVYKRQTFVLTVQTLTAKCKQRSEPETYSC